MKRRPPGYENSVVNAIEPKVLHALRGLQSSQRWPLVMTGLTGSGKTSAAAVLYGTFHQLPMWHRADDLLLAVSMGRKEGVQVDTLNAFGETVRRSIKFQDFVNRVIGCSCLFLDDLGTRAPTEPMYGALFDLLEWRKDRPLCVTTNKSAVELAELYDDRIASRLSSGTVIKFGGSDRREKSQAVIVDSQGR